MSRYHFPHDVRSLGSLVARSLGKSVLSKIVINHSDEDLALAAELHELLVREGWDVIDNRQLPVGQRLEEYLERALQTVDGVVTLWTSAAVESPRVRDVANEAYRLGVSVPVLVEAVVLPLGQRSIRAVELGSERNFEEVVSWVRTLLEGTQGASFADTDEVTPSLSLRIARRVIEALGNQGASLVSAEQVQPDVFYLGAWLVDVGANTIANDALVRKIQPRAMEVLVYLASRAPATVPVEEILDTVWKDRVVVDSAVHRCVSELRVAFDDDARAPKVIETIARRGYRLVANVTQAALPQNGAAAAPDDTG